MSAGAIVAHALTPARRNTPGIAIRSARVDQDSNDSLMSLPDRTRDHLARMQTFAVFQCRDPAANMPAMPMK